MIENQFAAARRETAQIGIDRVERVCGFFVGGLDRGIDGGS